MSSNKDNLFPIFGDIISRDDKESLLGQKGCVLWLTGLSGSGKSTVARLAERQLHEQGFIVKLLDGDNIRSRLNGDLGFSQEDRTENIRRVAEVAKLFVEAGVICICCFISPTRKIRNMCREIIGEDDFHEVAIKCSIEECEKRDVKGLYAKARRGEVKDFTGIHQAYEGPANAVLVIDTENLQESEGAKALVNYAIGLQASSE